MKRVKMPDISEIIEAKEILSDIEKSVSDPFLLMIDGESPDDADLHKTVQREENETILKLNKNLLPAEARYLSDMLSRFEKYIKNIISGTERIINKK